MTEVSVALVAAFAAIMGPVVLALMTRRVQRENRGDHYTVQTALEELTADTRELRADMREVRADQHFFREQLAALRKDVQ